MVDRISWRSLLAALLGLGLGACGGGVQMLQSGDAPVIRQGESMVVFMRPSAMGMAVAASVFDVSGPDTKFVGIVNYGTKVAYPLTPGEYTFMVVGESADFMRAKVLAGRTYHVLVTPRPGVWKARFSFRPVRPHELDGGDFAGWMSATHFVENSDQTRQWAVQNSPDITSKRAEYWPQWMSKPEEQRASQTLNAEDGKPTAFAAASSPALAAAAPALAAPAAAAPTSRAEPSASGVEIMFWESIRASSNPADFTAYLEQYPQGSFAPLARNRLAALGQPARATAAPASSRRPSQGDTWTYRLTEPTRVDGPKERNYTVKVSEASHAAISEEYAIEGGAAGKWTHKGAREVVPVGKPVFAPYLLVFSDLPPGGGLGRVQIDEGACGAAYLCQASGRIVNRETIKLTAGTFETVRVEIEQSWRPVAMTGHQGGQHYGARKLTAWYSLAAKRAVKFSSRATVGQFAPIDTDFDLELVNYRLQ